MALFSFGKDKPKEGGDPTVLAYLEDGQRVKAPAMIIDSRKNEIPCSIVAIQESSGSLQLQLRANLLAEKGTKIGFVMIIDNMRIGGTSKVQEVKPGSAVIDIPDSFELMERRKKQRAKINPREGTTCILLSGLFEGIGITGLPENLSENGIRLKVEKALQIPSEKPATVNSRNTPVGQIFPILKLSKIPRTVVTLEGAGRLVYSEANSGTLYLGITFEEMKGEFIKVLANFVSSRTSPLPNSLPPRARRQNVDVEGGGGGGSVGHDESPHGEAHTQPKAATSGSAPSESDKKPAKDEKSAASTPAPAATPSSAPTSTTTPTTPAESASSQVADGSTNEKSIVLNRPAPTPLQKLKRKTKTIVLFGTDQPVLIDLLKGEGYGRVECPEGMEELLGVIPPGGAGLLLLDLDMPLVNCFTVAGSILEHLEDPIPIILISENKQVGVRDNLDAQSIGVSLLLPRPLKIDDALFNKIEEILGLQQN